MIAPPRPLALARIAALCLVLCLPGLVLADEAGSEPSPPTTSTDAARAAADVAATPAAQQVAPPPAPKSKTPSPPFAYNPERRLQFDWVKISSGEWLKGDIVRMHRGRLFFDSDEFGDVDFDWDDVRILASKAVVTIRVENRDPVTARIDLRNGVARMHMGFGLRKVPQNQILSMIPGMLTERNYWSGGGSFGLAARSGNTEQLDVTLRANLLRQTQMTRWRSDYTGNISTANKSETANNHRVASQFDIYMTRKFFISTPVFEYYTDEFQNVDSRITVGAGVGYEVIDNSWLYFEVNGGVAYQYTDFNSVPIGSDVANDGAVFFKTRLDFDLPRGIEWNNNYSIQIVVSDIDKTSHHAETALEFDIWGPLDFEIAFIFDRIEQPVPDAAGNVPKSNDYRLTAGLGIDF